MVIVLVCFVMIAFCVIKMTLENRYKEMEREVLYSLGFGGWAIIPYHDAVVTVKSRQTLEKYDEIRYFKENQSALHRVEGVIAKKEKAASVLRSFLAGNGYKDKYRYDRLEMKIREQLRNAGAYRVCVQYISSAGNYLGDKTIAVTSESVKKYFDDPSLLMSKTEYNKYLKEQQKEAVEQKQHQYYERVNIVIDCANENRDCLVIKGSQDQLDRLVAQLFDRTVNSIKKIKSLDSEEWAVIDSFIGRIKTEVEKVVSDNLQILEYYDSADFQKIKETCEVLMSSQREFNEYITEKVQAVSQLFGTKVVRKETVHEDEYSYVRPYKKVITPFTAEVSATVFASAENSPLEYVVKNFYPSKALYPSQIQKLHLLVEELETLREAKQIIENYKAEYQQYLGDVPKFVLENDEAGFYSRLGFANIDESVLEVEYKFSYTSGGGMARRSFAVPMTEETIIDLIRMLESKLTASAFAKEQRLLMTK